MSKNQKSGTGNGINRTTPSISAKKRGNPSPPQNQPNADVVKLFPNNQKGVSKPQQELFDLINSLQEKRASIAQKIDSFDGYERTLKSLNGRKGSYTGHLKRANKKLENDDLDADKKLTLEAKIRNFQSKLDEAEKERLATKRSYNELRKTAEEDRKTLAEDEEHLKNLLEKLGLSTGENSLPNLNILQGQIPTNNQENEPQKTPLISQDDNAPSPPVQQEGSTTTTEQKENLEVGSKKGGPQEPTENSLVTKFRKVVPAIGGALLAAAPVTMTKILCTTALTPIIPFAAPVVGFAFGYSYNLRKDIELNYNSDLSRWENFKATFQKGGVLRNMQTHKNSAKSGLVGAAFGLAGGLGADAFLADACLAAPTDPASIKPPADITPTTDNASSAEAATTIPPAEECVDIVVSGNVVEETGEGTASAAEDCTPEIVGPEIVGPEIVGPEIVGPEIVGPEIVGLDSSNIIDVTALLDMAQGEVPIIQDILSVADTYNVDPAVIAELQAHVDAGFDFVDSAGAANAIQIHNNLLEGARMPQSPGGELVTPEEYGSVLESFITELNKAEFVLDRAGVIDDTYLDTGIRSELISQANTLRASI